MAHALCGIEPQMHHDNATAVVWLGAIKIGAFERKVETWDVM
jgi:hypothetical protein